METANIGIYQCKRGGLDKFQSFLPFGMIVQQLVKLGGDVNTDGYPRIALAQEFLGEYMSLSPVSTTTDENTSTSTTIGIAKRLSELWERTIGLTIATRLLEGNELIAALGVEKPGIVTFGNTQQRPYDWKK